MIICGIQQLGIGVKNVHEAWAWYRKVFGMRIPVFEEAAEANLMLPYTGGQSHKRHAILALNEQGGSGFEIWQYTSRTPQPPANEIVLGDLGHSIGKIKTDRIEEAMEKHLKMGIDVLGDLSEDPKGQKHYYLRDPWENIFEVTQGQELFRQTRELTGGPSGVVIGVSDIEKSFTVYRDILGYDEVVYDLSATFEDLSPLPGGDLKVRRVLLRHREDRQGPFSAMLGRSEIELVQALERTPVKIFENRFWGDLGYIHLCFDVVGMDEVRKLCEEKGHPFTVDSANSFDMGEAAGHFSYIEDPDGTWIEFVETHRIPIMKKLGWYLDLRKRDQQKRLPNWMLRALALNKHKN